uniref:Uncharacterized protein n=1 Tax=Gasterosteus aculeatus TaxID=69293 RepID=G3PHY3_GASAC
TSSGVKFPKDLIKLNPEPSQLYSAPSRRESLICRQQDDTSCRDGSSLAASLALSVLKWSVCHWSPFCLTRGGIPLHSSSVGFTSNAKSVSISLTADAAASGVGRNNS